MPNIELFLTAGHLGRSSAGPAEEGGEQQETGVKSQKSGVRKKTKRQPL